MIDPLYLVNPDDEQNGDFQGYVLGNPVTDTFIDDNSRIPYAHRLTLISDTLFAAANKSCNGDFVNVDSTNVDCVTDIDAIDEVKSADRYRILGSAPTLRETLN